MQIFYFQSMKKERSADNKRIDSNRFDLLEKNAKENPQFGYEKFDADSQFT